MATFLLDPVSCRYLCFEEGEEVAMLRAEGKGVREIAREIGRSPSTICPASRSVRHLLVEDLGGWEVPRSGAVSRSAEQREFL